LITEERQQLILLSLNQKGAVKVSDLVTQLNTSESTIRRDLVQLEDMNYLRRVHGGAVSVQSKVIERSYKDKQMQNNNQKDLIAKSATELISDGDSIYLDSGTSIYEMIKYLKNKKVLVVTNGISHVEALIDHEIPCILLGGKVKPMTKAVIGHATLKALENYRFDKCFLGTNGVHLTYGFTTPDPEEAYIKERAMMLAKETFILADDSKFGEVTFTKFADLNQVQIITNLEENLKDYQEKTTIRVV